MEWLNFNDTITCIPLPVKAEIAVKNLKVYVNIVLVSVFFPKNDNIVKKESEEKRSILDISTWI